MNISVSVVAALAAVYIFWGGTYLAMKFAIESLPPFTMAGFRFLTAGCIVFTWQLAKGVELPEFAHWRSAAVVGGLLLFGGNGGVVWSQQFVPSGIAAVVVAAVPLWMALLSWLWQGGRRPNGLAASGLLLGLFGIGLLVKNSGQGAASGQAIGYITLVAASISWATGSLQSRVAKLPSSPLMAIAMQMLTGGLMLVMLGGLVGEWPRVDLSQVSARSFLALAYLVLFGSIIGFSSYIWLLKAADPTLVATYAYVNPVVAVFLGWLLAGEQLTGQDLLAAAIILIAVALITKANSNCPSEPARSAQSMSELNTET